MTTPTPTYTPEQLREWADTYDRGEVEPGVVKPNRAEMYRAHAALLEDLAAAQEAIRKQGQSALMGMDAAKAIASHNLESAKAINAQSNPAALDEARALNERLTNELEAAQEAHAEQLRAVHARELVYANSLAQAQEARQRAEADAFTMAAGQCCVKSGGLMADDHGHQYCDMERQRNELRERAQRAEALAESNAKDAEFGQILMRYIDRLTDPTPEDSLEKIIGLLSADVHAAIAEGK